MGKLKEPFPVFSFHKMKVFGILLVLLFIALATARTSRLLFNYADWDCSNFSEDDRNLCLDYGECKNQAANVENKTGGARGDSIKACMCVTKGWASGTSLAPHKSYTCCESENNKDGCESYSVCKWKNKQGKCKGKN